MSNCVHVEFKIHYPNYIFYSLQVYFFIYVCVGVHVVYIHVPSTVPSRHLLLYTYIQAESRPSIDGVKVWSKWRVLHFFLVLLIHIAFLLYYRSNTTRYSNPQLL